MSEGFSDTQRLIMQLAQDTTESKGRLKAIEASMEKLLQSTDKLVSLEIKHQKQEETNRRIFGRLERVEGATQDLEDRTAFVRREVVEIQTAAHTGGHMLKLFWTVFGSTILAGGSWVFVNIAAHHDQLLQLQHQLTTLKEQK